LLTILILSPLTNACRSAGLEDQKTVPRLVSALTAAASGVVLSVAALAPVRAQTPQPAPPNVVAQAGQAPAGDQEDLFRLPDAATVFAPLRNDPRAPGRFRRANPSGPSAAPTRVGQIQVYGNPPALGAGATGFDSTNAQKKKARAAVKQKPGVSLPLPPPPGVVPDPPVPTVPVRPLPQDPRRGVAVQPQPPQQAYVPLIATPTRRKLVVEEDPFAPVGIRAGAFTFFPAVELTGGFDTNPAHVPGGKGSWLAIVAPELKVRSDWERHQLNADIKGNYLAYAETFGFTSNGVPTGVPDSLDRPSLDARVNGRLDVNSRGRFDMEGRLLVGTDNPGSPNIQAGLARLPVTVTLGTTIGYTQSFNRFELSAKTTVDRSVWQASTFTDGETSSNNDRNFDQFGGTFRASYDLKPGIKPFAEVGADTRVHDLQFDRNGEDRDSNGFTARVGTTFEFSRKLTGEFAVGWLTRQYKDPALNNIGGLLVDASLVYTLSALTTATVTAKSTVNEVILPGVSGDLSHDFGLQIDHAFRRWLIGTAKVGYGVDDYVGLARLDHRYYASIAATYKLTREFQLKGEVRRDWIASSSPGVDYVADQFLLGVRMQR
jgi:hypothetical protein